MRSRDSDLRWLAAAVAVAAAVPAARSAPPGDAPLIPLSEVTAGRRGEVWTVFRGTQPEPFTVVVTGVIHNALGPGKSLIVCELTDPRVQPMGAVAGMSGSPLYLDGRLAGALSYQIQRFETVRHAGFTPAADLEEVRALPSGGPALSAWPGPESSPAPLQPVFTAGGLSPAAAAALGPLLASAGLGTLVPGGAKATGAATIPPETLVPGGAVAVALATGDITLAATGTVALVRDRQLVAFGHPMLALGDVELPLCAAEVVTILPSQMQSVKVANVGPVIGTLRQDRLSAVAGELGPGPGMIDVTVAGRTGEPLRFAVARHPQLAPLIVAAGLTQALLGSNDAGFSQGFQLKGHLEFPGGASWTLSTLHAGPQALMPGVSELVQSLSGLLQNPFARVYPERLRLEVKALSSHPGITVERFQLSRATVAPRGELAAELSWRDWQGAPAQVVVPIPIAAAWEGRTLEVVLAPGRALDELTGRPRGVPAAELRSFAAYLNFLRTERRPDGLYLAVAQRVALFSDQTAATAELPGSIERIARGADEARFRRRDGLVVLWETHLLPDRLASTVVRRALTVAE